MRRRRNIGLIAASLLLILVADGWANGSIYSLRGFGVLYHRVSGRVAGMGGAGLAMADTTHLNWLNPAALTLVRKVQVSAEFFYQNLSISNGRQSFYTNYANFHGFMGAFSVGYGIGIGFGIFPYSKIDYRFEDRSEFEGNDFYRVISGRGGLNRASISVGFTPVSFLRVGAGFGYLFGKVDDELRILYIRPDFWDSYDQVRSKYSGANAHFGVILMPMRRFHVAAYYEGKVNLKKSSQYRKVNPANGLVRVMRTLEESAGLPEKWGGGIFWEVRPRLYLAADYMRQDWTKYSGSTPSMYVTMEEIFSGLEWTPSDRYDAPWYQRIAYRMGFSWQKPYMLDFTGREMREWTVTFGIGIPFAHGFGSLDIALEYGKRGATPTTAFEEQMFKVRVFATGSEWWFVR
jgi:long-subunit fatty acid transport protein